MSELGMVVEILFVREYTDALQLPLQGVLCEGSLGHVRPVQAIHTVGPNHPSLSMRGFGGSGIPTNVDMEVTHLRQILVQHVYEQLDAMEAQSAAFVVEIKVDIVRLWFSASLESLFHRILDGKLVPLVVDEIDKVGVPVQPDLLFDVELQCLDLLTEGNLVNTTIRARRAGILLAVSGKSMTCISGLYLRLLTSAQNKGILPRI
jgi:hypothetical protein